MGVSKGIGEAALARGFHESVAAGLSAMTRRLCEEYRMDTVVLSGGVFQNAVLTDCFRARLPGPLHIWTNLHVPPNDGGIGLGPAAVDALSVSSTRRG